MSVKLPRLNAEHILYGISIANALRLAWAYAVSDAGGNVISLPGLFGLMLGASISVGTAFVAGKLGGKLTNTRKAISWTVFIVLLVLEPMILAPITMTNLSDDMAQVLGRTMSWVWAVTLASVPSILLAGVAVANGGLVDTVAHAPQIQGTATGATDSVGVAGRTAKSAKHSAPEMRTCKVEGCGMPYRWPQGKGAHYKKWHKDLVIVKGIPAGVSLPLEKP